MTLPLCTVIALIVIDHCRLVNEVKNGQGIDLESDAFSNSRHRWPDDIEVMLVCQLSFPLGIVTDKCILKRKSNNNNSSSGDDVSSNLRCSSTQHDAAPEVESKYLLQNCTDPAFSISCWPANQRSLGKLPTLLISANSSNIQRYLNNSCSSSAVIAEVSLGPTTSQNNYAQIVPIVVVISLAVIAFISALIAANFVRRKKAGDSDSESGSCDVELVQQNHNHSQHSLDQIRNHGEEESSCLISAENGGLRCAYSKENINHSNPQQQIDSISNFLEQSVLPSCIASLNHLGRLKLEQILKRYENDSCDAIVGYWRLLWHLTKFGEQCPQILLSSDNQQGYKLIVECLELANDLPSSDDDSKQLLRRSCMGVLYNCAQFDLLRPLLLADQSNEYSYLAVCQELLNDPDFAVAHLALGVLAVLQADDDNQKRCRQAINTINNDVFGDNIESSRWRQVRPTKFGFTFVRSQLQAMLERQGCGGSTPTFAVEERMKCLHSFASWTLANVMISDD